MSKNEGVNSQEEIKIVQESIVAIIQGKNLIGSTEKFAYDVLKLKFSSNEVKEILTLINNPKDQKNLSLLHDLENECIDELSKLSAEKAYYLANIDTINALIRYELIQHLQLPLLGQEQKDEEGSIIPLFESRDWERIDQY